MAVQAGRVKRVHGCAISGSEHRSKKPLVSVIVPARNEAGNVPEIMRRVPQMGAGTELVFVEGHSQDNTYDVIESAISENPHRLCKLFRQTGEGKGDAVRLGFEKADGEILMILDADLTVPPEDLPRFYDALVSGKGEFINGVRSVYPMEDQAMRYLNIVGNRFFSLCFSFLLGQNIKDTLCGTKVLWKNQYEIIAANRSFFGKLDPFRRFRSHPWGSPLEFENTRPPNPISRACVRRHKYPALETRPALVANGRCRSLAA